MWAVQYLWNQGVNIWREANRLAPRIFHISPAKIQTCIFWALSAPFHPGFKLPRPGSGLFCPKLSSGNPDYDARYTFLESDF